MTPPLPASARVCTRHTGAGRTNADAHAAAAAMAARAQQATPAADSSNVAQVPDDLHNYLHAQVDAKGNVRILETDGPTAPTKAVELTNE